MNIGVSQNRIDSTIIANAVICQQPQERPLVDLADSSIIIDNFVNSNNILRWSILNDVIQNDPTPGEETKRTGNVSSYSVKQKGSAYALSIQADDVTFSQLKKSLHNKQMYVYFITESNALKGILSADGLNLKTIDVKVTVTRADAADDKNQECMITFTITDPAQKAYDFGGFELYPNVYNTVSPTDFFALRSSIAARIDGKTSGTTAVYKFTPRDYAKNPIFNNWTVTDFTLKKDSTPVVISTISQDENTGEVTIGYTSTAGSHTISANQTTELISIGGQPYDFENTFTFTIAA